jgi:LysM repeat protein
MQAIMHANGIYNANYIQVGQRLTIPSTCGPTPVPATPQPQPCSVIYIVQRGDTLYSLARRYGTTVQAIAQWNNILNPSRIFAGQRLVIYRCAPVPPPPPPACRTHIVQRGETLYSLACRYGTTVWRLAMLNNLANPNIIYAGQRLVLPC